MAIPNMLVVSAATATDKCAIVVFAAWNCCLVAWLLLWCVVLWFDLFFAVCIVEQRRMSSKPAVKASSLSSLSSSPSSSSSPSIPSLQPPKEGEEKKVEAVVEDEKEMEATEAPQEPISGSRTVKRSEPVSGFDKPEAAKRARPAVPVE